VAKIIEIGEGGIGATELEPAKIEGKSLETRRNCMLSWIKSDEESNSWLFQKLTTIVNEINKMYFGLDLTEIESLQFTRYSSDTADFYVPHMDLMYKSHIVRKLSFSVQLSDSNEYEGGELKLYFRDSPDIAIKDKASISFFPSYMLHEVTPVTKGTRYSLVGWVTGPPFK
jgi:PKHD-type hydroxylase